MPETSGRRGRRLGDEGRSIRAPVGDGATAKRPAAPLSAGAERRARERRRRKPDAQRDFLSLVTHELKNPLATIKGYAQLLRRRGTYDAAALDAILSGARRLERLLNDLLDTAQADAGRLALRPERTDLATLVVAAAADAQAVTARHTVHAEVPREPVIGMWDAQRLAQVLQNLLGNALKYAPDGTQILARLEPWQDTGQVCVTVVDQGPGLPPDTLPHLFGRFYRTPAAQASDMQGLGLGLYISRMLVEAHGGHIWAEPVGSGTAFRCVLPGLTPAKERL